MKKRLGTWWRGLSTRGKAVVVGVAAVLILAIGATGGQPTTDTANATPSPSVTTTPVAVASVVPSVAAATTPVRSAPTAISTGTADSVAQYGSQIPGLAAADVKLNLENRGFTCEGPTTFLDGIDYICESSPDATSDYRVEIIGMNPTDIRSVEAAYFWYGDKSQMDAGADEFLGYIATLPYDGAKPQEARTWVQADETGATTFGGAKFTLTTAGTGLVRILEISGS